MGGQAVIRQTGYRRNGAPQPIPQGRSGPLDLRPLEPERNGVRDGRETLAGKRTVRGIDHVAHAAGRASRPGSRARAGRAARRARRRCAVRRLRASRHHPGTGPRDECCHAHARYAASEPPSNEPKPISSRPGSTTNGTPRPASASARVSDARRKRELTPSSIGSVSSCAPRAHGLLGALRREALSRRDAVDRVARIGGRMRVPREDQGLEHDKALTLSVTAARSGRRARDACRPTRRA